MKKMLSISDNVAKMLETLAKNNGSTQSKMVEIALLQFVDKYKLNGGQGFKVLR